MGARIVYPSQEDLLKTFRYEDGQLFWREPGYNRRNLSKPAGSKFPNGYLSVSWSEDGKRSRLLVHRVVWIMHHGVVPQTIDHINRDRTDNRIENLRDVSMSINHMNRRDTHRVYDLPRGVSLQAPGRYSAQRRLNGTQTCIGVYDTPEKAFIAYVAFSKGAGLPVYET